MTQSKFQVGVHERGSGLKDVSPVEDWEQRWESEKMPKILPRIGIETEIIPDFLHQALVLAEKHQPVTIKLLHNAKDVDLALSRPKEELAQILHITSLPNLLEAPLPHLVEQPWPPFPANCSVPPSKDPGFLLHILWTLTQRQIPVQTLSLFTAQRGLSSLSLDHSYFPATLSTFQVIHGTQKNGNRDN